MSCRLHSPAGTSPCWWPCPEAVTDTTPVRLPAGSHEQVSAFQKRIESWFWGRSVLLSDQRGHRQVREDEAPGQGRCAPTGRKLPVTRFGGCEAPHASPRPRHEGAERRLSYLVSGRGSRNRAQCSPGTGSKVRSGRADPVSAPPPHCAAVSRSASRCPLCLKRNDRSQGDWRLEVIFKMTADYSRLHCFASGVYEH